MEQAVGDHGRIAADQVGPPHDALPPEVRRRPVPEPLHPQERAGRVLHGVGHEAQEPARGTAIAHAVVEGEVSVVTLRTASSPLTTQGLSMMRPMPRMPTPGVVNDGRGAVRAEQCR